MPTQQWGPIPNFKEYTYNAGVVTPAIEDVNFTIIDHPEFLDYAYSDFRLRKFTEYNPYDIAPWIVAGINGTSYQPYFYGLDFSFTPAFQNLESLPVGQYVFQHVFEIQGLNSYGVWEDIDYYTYETIMTVAGVVVEPDPVFSFSPSTLAFYHQQNNPLPSLNVLLTGNLWKIVGKPNFILSSTAVGVTIATVGSGASAYQTASGSGIAFVNIALSSFYDSDVDFIPTDLASTFEVLQNNVHFGNINWTVEVVRLADFLTIPYPANQKAFTLDTKYFEFQSKNQNTYFQFNALIKTYDFFTNVLNEYAIPQKIVLFNGKQKINLGQLIHRLMRKFPSVNDNLLQYKLATLTITCSEILVTDESIVRSGTTPEIQFVAGHSRGITNLGFLDFNPLANRGTKNGFAYLNMLYPSGSYELRTFKNGTLVTSEALPAYDNKIICKKVLFSDYYQGDIVQYIVDVVGENNSTAPKKIFKMLPEGNYSNTIVWENEFLLQSALECTGTASIKSDFEFTSQKVYENLVEKLDYLSSSKEVKLFINTGWLIKSDIDTIESLMRSKKAWLVNTKGNISLRPINKAMVNEDLARELIEFSLEFIINRTYDEETYSL